MVENLIKISVLNRNIVQKITQEMCCSLSDLWESPDKSRIAGEIFMREFLGCKKYEMFQSSALNNNDNTLLVTDNKLMLAKELVHQKINMIVLRPDMYHLKESVIRFLEMFHYEIVKDHSVQVGLESYWQLCKSAIVHPNAAESMPTRSLIYTQSCSSAIFFRDTLSRDTNYIDYFFQTHKGKQGVAVKDTLRGDLIYREAQKLQSLIMKDETIRLACDPFGSYIHRSKKNGVNEPHLHLPLSDRLLQYIGVGVHVPESGELLNDVCSLLSEEEMCNLCLS
ncbi:MAG: hypothetical protein ACJAV6_000002 [Candidatus Paceibacteria bacterium]|jgi:hypothetical protein